MSASVSSGQTSAESPEAFGGSMETFPTGKAFVEGCRLAVTDEWLKGWEMCRTLGMVRERVIEKPREPYCLYLTARQIQSACEWALPPGHEPDDLNTIWRIGTREPGTDEDGEPYEGGPVMWLDDYPEEGCLPLDTADPSPTALGPSPEAPEPDEKNPSI